MTRKGAIRAGRGELGIIPGSMGTKSYIVRGLGNPQSFESASHGAGRRMSRSQATQALHAARPARTDRGRRVPQGRRRRRRDARGLQGHRQVMEQQQDLVEIVAELKQVVCVKG